MRPRTSVPLALSCAVVALTGCGSSNLLDGSSAQDLQQSLSSVSQAVDAGECADARKAARKGLQRVSDLPSSVDSELRSRLRTGFEELQDRISTDCEQETTTTTPPVTTVPETTTDTAPVDPAPEDTVPDDTTTQDTPPDDTTTAPDDGSGSGSGSGGTGTGDGGGSSDDGGDTGGSDSGGVVPGVDGPGAGAGERGVRRLEQRGKELRKRAEKAWRDLQKQARGQG